MKVEAKEWYETIFEYWAQITVLLGIIGFCIGKILEFNIKKNEIRFSKLHENKILEIKTYYKSYQSLRNALQRFYNQTVFGTHSEEIFKSLSNDISEKFIEFDYDSMIIKLFIDNKDLEIVDDITKTLSVVRAELLIWHINARPNNSTNNQDNIEKIGQVLDKRLPELIKNIENNLRKNFNSI